MLMKAVAVLFVSVLSLGGLLGTLIPVTTDTAQAVSTDEPVIDLLSVELPEKGYPKLDSALWQLSTAWKNGKAASFALQSNFGLTIDGVRVIIKATPDQATAAVEAAVALGARVEASYGDLVQVMVPVASIITLSEDPSVRAVSLPQSPVPTIMFCSFGDRIAKHNYDLVGAQHRR